MPSKTSMFSRVVTVTMLLILSWIAFGNLYRDTLTEKDFSTFYQEMTGHALKSVLIKNGEILGEDLKGNRFKTAIPPDAGYNLAKELQQNGVSVKVTHESTYSIWYFIGSLIPWLLIFIGFSWFIRRIGQNNPLSAFGASKAKRFVAQEQSITFRDVAGVEEAKTELQEIVEFLKNPRKFQKLGGKIPKGVLLVGLPGTGKTLLAKAVAGEAGVPFFSISGSAFVEMFVGVGARRIRDLFVEAKKVAPCIVFIDEIDAVGRRRGTGLGGGHDEREQTLNQLLVEMDGFDTNNGVIIIAASNRADILDPALLRPGRFDRNVNVPLPDIRGREAILRVHTRNKSLGEDVDLPLIARGTPGFSGADLANLVNEAALYATKYDRDKITAVDFEEAKDKIIMGGTPRRSTIMSEKQKRLTAYHEAGHAVVAYMIPEAYPLHKISIIPRGPALGVTVQIPEEDIYNFTRRDAEARVAICMGGRCAETIFLDTATSGCSNDFEQATEIASSMVKRWGMGLIQVPRVFGERTEQPFLGLSLTRQDNYSEKTAQQLDEKIDDILQRGYTSAKKILENHKTLVEKLVQSLLEKETLNLKEIQSILGPRPA